MLSRGNIVKYFILSSISVNLLFTASIFLYGQKRYYLNKILDLSSIAIDLQARDIAEGNYRRVVEELSGFLLKKNIVRPNISIWNKFDNDLLFSNERLPIYFCKDSNQDVFSLGSFMMPIICINFNGSIMIQFVYPKKDFFNYLALGDFQIPLGLGILISFMLTVLVIFFTKKYIQGLFKFIQDTLLGEPQENAPLEYRNLVQPIDNLKQTVETLNRQIVDQTRIKIIAQTTQMLAHDVRQPFSIMRSGLNDLLRNQLPNSFRIKLTNLAHDIDRSLNFVNGMIQDIMEISSNKKPVLTNILPEFIINAVLSQTFSFRENLDIKINHCFCHRHKIRAEERKVMRLLANIVDNAIQAMNGKGLLWFKTDELLINKIRFLRLEIGNNGPLIVAPDLADIFKPFFTKNKINGTGLGLAISQKIVFDHGGQIWCESDTTNLTRFIFTLPASTETACPLNNLPEYSRDYLKSKHAVPPSRQFFCLTKKGPRLKIALIDDEPFIQDAWIRSLGKEQVNVFSSPLQFWETIRKRPDFVSSLSCVITDYYFGPFVQDNGISFAKRLKYSYSNLPILLSTDAAIRDDEIGAIDLVIDKTPLPTNQLIEILSLHEYSK